MMVIVKEARGGRRRACTYVASPRAMTSSSCSRQCQSTGARHWVCLEGAGQWPGHVKRASVRAKLEQNEHQLTCLVSRLHEVLTPAHPPAEIGRSFDIWPNVADSGGRAQTDFSPGLRLSAPSTPRLPASAGCPAALASSIVHCTVISRRSRTANLASQVSQRGTLNGA